jgi:hypothetical protein
VKNWDGVFIAAAAAFGAAGTKPCGATPFSA